MSDYQPGEPMFQFRYRSGQADPYRMRQSDYSDIQLMNQHIDSTMSDSAWLRLCREVSDADQTETA